MKTSIFRVTAAAFAAALVGTVGCSSGGCGGQNLNQNTGSAGQSTLQCGTGTYLNSHNQCVPRPASTTSGSNTNTTTSSPIH